MDSLRHVWRIGPTPTPQPVVIGSGSGVGGGSKHGSSASFVGSPGTAVASPGVTSKLAYLNSLGDTAVDFDIAPPRVVSSATGGSGSVGADTTFSPTTTLSTTSSTVTATKPAIAPKEGTLMNVGVLPCYLAACVGGTLGLFVCSLAHYTFRAISSQNDGDAPQKSFSVHGCTIFACCIGRGANSVVLGVSVGRPF